MQDFKPIDLGVRFNIKQRKYLTTAVIANKGLGYFDSIIPLPQYRSLIRPHLIYVAQLYAAH